MAERRTLAFLLATLALAGATSTVWWILARSSDPIQDHAADLPQATAAEVASAREGSALRTPAALERDLGRTLADASARHAVKRSESFDLDDAQWVEGRILVPPALPADEVLEILALGFSESEPDLETLKDEEVRFGERENPPGRSWARRSPDADGRFRVPFSKQARRAQVQLRARYLHVGEPIAFELPCEPLTLRPELGGWITGRIVLPRDLPADVGPEGLAGKPVKVVAYGAKHYERETRVDEDLTFEAGGLAASVPHAVTMFCKTLCPKPLLDVRVQPGQHLDLDLVLIHGAMVSGRVVDRSGAPIGGARVRRKKNNYVAALRSDADGRFALRALSPGKWTISVQADGYPQAQSHELELADRQVVEGLEIVLERGKTISGRILWPEGGPASGARISLYSPFFVLSGTILGWQYSSTHEADAKGEFEINGLEDASYRLRAVALRDGAGEAALATCYARQDGVPAGSEVVLQLEPSCSIRGSARDDLGAPIPIFTVHAVDESDVQFQTRDFEDPRGAFEWRGLECRAWTVYVQAMGYESSERPIIRLPSAQQSEFVLPRAADVHGRVLDGDGTPIAGANIEVRPLADDGSSWSGEEPEIATGEDGGFEIEGVSPETVILRASAVGFAPAETEPLDLAPGETRRDVLIALGSGGTLTGEILDAREKPQPGRTIQIWTGTSGDVSATSDEAGRFRAEHLAPGTYHLMASPDFGALAMAEEPFGVENAGMPLMASVEIREGETTHVVLGGAPRAPMRLHGRVMKGGKPVADCQVAAFADGAAMLSSIKQASTDSSGRYELQLDSPGDYTLIVEHEGSTEFHERIPEVAQHELDLELPSGSIAGRVMDATGAPLAGAEVTLEREDQVSIFSLFGATLDLDTDRGGHFAFENLSPGTYAIRARGPGDGEQHAVAIRSGIRVPADGAVEGVDLRLPRPSAVKGRVLSVDRKPLAGAIVFLRQERGPLVSNAMTDKSGRFRIDAVPPGTFTLFARRGPLASEESPPVQIREGSSAEVELVLQPGTILRVSPVDGEGTGLRASLSVTDRLGREFARAFTEADLEEVFTQGFLSTVQRVGPLPPGEYAVRATTSDGRSASSSVTLSGQAERHVELELKQK